MIEKQTKHIRELEAFEREGEDELARIQLEVAKSKGAYELTLSEPFKALGTTITKLTFRPMTMKDKRQAGDPEKDPEGWTLKLLAALTEVPSEDLESLCPSDWEACSAVVLGLRRRRGAR